jgi:predicted nucleotidyltransferase
MPQLELARLQLSAAHLAVLQSLLAEYVPIAEVWAYGSRVTGGAHEGSDLDLVLRHPQDLKQEVPDWFELKEALQDSRLPMLVELHLWPRVPVSFHAEIERAYVVIQAGGEVGV